MLFLHGMFDHTDGFVELSALWGLFSEDSNVYLFGTKHEPEGLLTNINAAISQESERSQRFGGLKLAGWGMTETIWPSLVNFSVREGRVVAPSMRHQLDRKYNDSWNYLDVDRIYTQGFDRYIVPCLGAALTYWLKRDFMTEAKLKDAWMAADCKPTEEIGLVVADYLRGTKEIVDRYYSEPPND